MHAHNAKLCIQLGCGLGKNAFVFEGNVGDIVSASDNPIFWAPDKKCRPMTKEEIKETVDCFGRAAKRVLDAEGDAIEIHAHVGYLLDQFMTPAWNRRIDEYGGTFENRMRFITEVYEAIRQVVGKQFPILVRMVSDHDYVGGRGSEESIKIVQYLERLGVDALDIDLGCYEDRKWITPTHFAGESCMADGAAEIKKAVKIPVLNAGNHTPDSALRTVEDGKADIILMGRPLLADPDVPNKLMQGVPEDVRPCLFCNECTGRSAMGLYIRCAINAQAAAESDYQLHKAEKPKNIVVIGGGPAGLESARVAAERGHKVALFEKDEELGGQLIPASAPSFKHHIKAFLEYEKTQLQKSNVTIRLGKSIDENAPELKDADCIMVALGADPIMPLIKGIDGQNVVEVTASHAAPELVKGERIVVAGGGLSGCDAAIELAMEGKKVTIVEMQDTIAADVTKLDNRNWLLKKLGDYNVNILTGHTVVEFNDKSAIVKAPDGSLKTLEADTIITAFGMSSRKELTDRICDKYPITAISIGDGNKIGQILGAVRGGFFAGWSV